MVRLLQLPVLDVRIGSKEGQVSYPLTRGPKVPFIGTAVVAFGAFYEIFFNFAIWSALIAVTSANCTPLPCNPDVLANPYPNTRTTLNLVFATKVVITVFALSIYSLWFLNRVEKDLDRKEAASRSR